MGYWITFGWPRPTKLLRLNRLVILIGNTAGRISHQQIITLFSACHSVVGSSSASPGSCGWQLPPIIEQIKSFILKNRVRVKILTQAVNLSRSTLVYLPIQGTQGTQRTAQLGLKKWRNPSPPMCALTQVGVVGTPKGPNCHANVRPHCKHKSRPLRELSGCIHVWPWLALAGQIPT